MLGRLILILLQVIITWFAAPKVAAYVHLGGELDKFVFALICAILVFLIGVIGALVLKEVGSPGSATLTWSLVLALIAAAIAIWGPQLVPAIARIPDNALILAGAVIGYHAKR